MGRGVTLWNPTGRSNEDAERRLLTVIFCDLVGSSALSESMDPEDLRELINRFQGACANAVSALEGHVAQYLGDGLLVYFGFPSAGENDAQRAVQCGLAIIEALGQLNAERAAVGQGPNLSVRIGIDTGVVVVGQVPSAGGNERLALGEPPNVAARLQSIAAPDTVLIGESTHRLVQGWFACETVPVAALRGFSRPIQAFRVLGPKPVRSRMEVALQEGLSPFVGRRQEMRLLLDAWSQGREERGSSVLIDGEPGIGKSRLAQELKIAVAREGAGVQTLTCSADHKSSPFHPVLDALSRTLGFAATDSPEQKLAKLERAAASRPDISADSVALLSHLFSLGDAAEGAANPPFRVRRVRAREVLTDWLLDEARTRPLLIVWEDLQWADPSSLELLAVLMARVRSRRSFLLLTCRSGFELGRADAALIHVTIGKLDRETAAELVRHVADKQTISDAVADQLLEKGDGVPLFIEELTKAFIERSRVPTDGMRAGPMLPPTLQSLLMSRLDALPYGKEVARLAATVGREFPSDLLRAIWPLGPDFLEKGLAELSARKLILQNEPGVWVFKHALIRDVSYESILHRTRRQYHSRIATTLEESWPEKIAAEPETLAHHYAQAGMKEESAGYWYRAGALAIDRSASVEAVDHFNRGLALLETLPETPELVERKLEFLLALGGPLLALRGYASPDVGALFVRAEALCEGLPRESRLFDVLQGLHSHHLVRGDLESALELSRRMHTLAQRLGDQSQTFEAQLRVGISLYALAQLEDAREILETRLVSPGDRSSGFYLFGQDPHVTRLCHLSLVLWLLGRPEDALQRAAEAKQVAEDLKHSFTLSWALYYDAVIHACCGNVAGALTRAEGLISLCSEQGFAYRLAQGRIIAGWARALGGDESGLTQIGSAIAAVRATGALVLLPYYLALMADACLALKDSRGGLAAIDEGEAMVSKTKESFYLSELTRLKAELMLLQSPDAHGEAERLLRQSLSEASGRMAWSLAMRSSLSLARLLAQQGRVVQGKEILAATRARVSGEGCPELAHADLFLRSLG